MGDTTWSVKMPNELKTQLSEMIEQSGLSGKDFMNDMMQAYDIQRTKQLVPIIEHDLDELKDHTDRIVSIFINIGERIDNIMKTKGIEFSKDMQQKDNTINLFQEKLSKVESDIGIYKNTAELAMKDKEDMQNRMTELETEIEERINQFSKVNESNEALIKQYKEKIDTLSGLVNEYKNAKNENDTLNKLLNNANNRVNNLEIKLTSLENEIVTVKDKMLFEKEKAILSIEKEYQFKLQQVKDEYNQKVSDMIINKKEESKPKIILGVR